MKASERRLIAILAVLALLCGGAILTQRLFSRLRGIERREQGIALRQMEARAMLSEAALWRQRLDWLRAHQPGMTSENMASEKLLEEVLAAASAQRLVVQKKQLHEASRQASYHEVGVTLAVVGELPDVFRWLHGLLSPSSFQSVTQLKITPDPAEKTKVSAIVRVNRLHAPAMAASNHAREGRGS